MKSFIAAVIIIICVIILISVNAYFSAKIADELLLSLDDLKREQSENAYKTFLVMWDKHSTYLSLTTARGKLKAAESGLMLIASSLENSNYYGFSRGVAQLEDAIVEIADFSAFDFEDIL